MGSCVTATNKFSERPQFRNLDIIYLLKNYTSLLKYTMLSLVKGPMQRLGVRCISSVVPKSDIAVTDFTVKNEPVLGYLAGSTEREELSAALARHQDVTEDIPIVIGGKEYRTDDVRYQPMPHNHGKKVAKFYYATPELVGKAIDTSLQAKKEWEKVPLDEKFKLFLDVADLMATKYRADLNATTMLGQAKTVIQAVGNNLSTYTGFPKLIGECGGKNYHFVHTSADVESVVNGTVRSAFEYQGQKCSACSRMYVPESLWPQVKEGLVEVQKTLKMGDVADFGNFMSAVIDQKAFDRISGYIKHAKSGPNTKIVAGGNCDDSVGFFIEPTVVETSSKDDKIFKEELFGPVVTAFVYKDADATNIVNQIGKDTPYALTGAIYSEDQAFADTAAQVLRGTAGNFYVNDKSTGSVVGQQPFGGARLSGTNDKAGGPHYMLKWASPQAVKQTFVPLPSVSYPYMNQ